MRLSQKTRQIIRDTVREIFGIEATVTLLGSKVDDNVRGGDIDLLIEFPNTVLGSERKAMRLTAKLQVRIADQPIDVLVIDPIA